MVPECTIEKPDLRNGKVAIRATCPPDSTGYDRGTMSLTGRWRTTGYDLVHDTHLHGANGTWDLPVRWARWWIGDCPAPGSVG